MAQEQPPNNPAFLVKIENTAGGEPQYGVNQADFVIEELVEGGITRLAAIFYSKLPTKVGHVRSTRTTDIGLWPSRSAPRSSRRAVRRRRSTTSRNPAPQLFTYDAGAPGYSSDPSKSAPYHVLWDIQKLNETAKRGAVPNNPYFSFGDRPCCRGRHRRRQRRASVKFSPATTTGWRFSGGKWSLTKSRAAAGQAYKRGHAGRDLRSRRGGRLQRRRRQPGPRDRLEGSGRAVIFSGDSAVEATWHKGGLGGTMTFTAKSSGKPVTLKPGHVFLEAAPRGGDVKY